MRRTFSRRLSRLAATLVAAILAWPAAGQDVKTGSGNLDLASFVGVWTVAANGDCTRSLYSWTVRGNELQFLGPNGAVDVERVVALRPDGFTAVTLSSPSNPPGTNWDFRLIAPSTFRVLNLRTSHGFELRRCDGASALRPTPTREPDMVWGSSPDGLHLWHGVPDSDVLALSLGCTPNQRTMSVTVNSPDLPVGRRVRVTASVGSTTTNFDAVYQDGLAGYAQTTLPVSHPILAMLRSGERALSMQVAGRAFVIPLAGVASHARRFEAACRG